MRLRSWLLIILGLATLVAASLSWWPPDLGLQAPSGIEAAVLAALGAGCLVIAGSFIRADRREPIARRAAAAARESLASELVASGVIADFVEHTRLERLRLYARRDDGEPDAFVNSFGGVFYVPPGFAWPLTTDLRPMWPLAQLNFAELPRLDGFPDRGILQFFITGDDMYGMDPDDPARQSGFRVIYHPEVGTSTFPNPAQPDGGRLTVPFEGAFRLSATAGTMPMTVSDWRFPRAIDDSWRRCTGSGPGPDVSSAAYDLVLDAATQRDPAAVEGDGLLGAHQIGGYALFTQEDPRGYEEKWRGHTTVLLQIDSVGDDIMWGDMGVASFLIEPQRLSQCDFSNVLYTWDCY
jgi:uncharacterized protein YwqG